MPRVQVEVPPGPGSEEVDSFLVGHCHDTVTANNTGTIKGFIYLYLNYYSTAAEFGGSIQSFWT